MKRSLFDLIPNINNKQQKVSTEACNLIDEASMMITYLQEELSSARTFVYENGFKNDMEEIAFFRNIKPEILGKLIYYNKVYRIEISCPATEGKIYQAHFMAHTEELKQEYKEHICGSDFYRYYRSGRKDKDNFYYQRGNINYHEGLNSFVFEIDPKFSTYYDYKVARIVANDLLYSYLINKISLDESSDTVFQNSDAIKDLLWTDSKNALIELIYALHVSKSVSHGEVGIRKLSLVIQILFKIPLNDIHHAFHRMKDRTGSRTVYLDYLKQCLDDYMDKSL